MSGFHWVHPERRFLVLVEKSREEPGEGLWQGRGAFPCSSTYFEL